ANIGKVGKSEFDSSFSNLPKIISLTPTESGEIEIILHVSNFFLSNGGIFYNIYLGKLNYLEKMRENQLILDFFLFGSIGIMGFYHFGLFLLRRNDKSTLYFSIFCLLSSIRPFFVGERYISSLINPEFHIYLLKAEYLNVYMLAPFFLLFQVSLFKNDFSKLITRLLNTIFITFILLVIFTDSNLYTSTLSYWQILVLIVFLYILFCIFRAAFNKREGALPFLSGLLCVILASVNDILHVQEIIQTGYYFPIGLLVFIISQAYILSANFSNAFKQSEISREEAEMQKKLAQKREVEIKQLNKAKDEFLANLSHELKTPLTYIYMYSEILSTTNEKETVIGYAKDLLANSKKLKEYLEDLILITDLETNIQLNLEKKSLQELVRIELDKLNDLAKEKQVQIKLEIPKSIDVNVDKKIFGKAIYSILKNSIVFNKINGLISIGARFDEESIFLSITDTGIGIEKKYLDKIFDKFFRIDSSLSYKVSGVGIGLYLAKKTIELHQGHLTVLSELNIGSTFTIQIYRF
ncbi:MAG TPA: sensor histidine kinase, partial [Leptospiraceae bacterium]|nr:sensor histidine kinase [Leptospiraceae bacterium]